MRSLTIALSILLSVGGVFAQGDRGTITGTIADPAGAVIAAAAMNPRTQKPAPYTKLRARLPGTTLLRNYPPARTSFPSPCPVSKSIRGKD